MFYPSLNEALNALSIALIVMIISMLGYLTRKLDQNGDIGHGKRRRRRDPDELEDGPVDQI